MFTSADLMYPSSPWWIFMMCSMGHSCGSTNTTSALSRCLGGKECHFCLTCRPDRYFLLNLDQNWLVRVCECHQHLQDLWLRIDHLEEWSIRWPHKQTIWCHRFNLSNVSRCITQWFWVENSLNLQDNCEEDFFMDRLGTHMGVECRLDRIVFSLRNNLPDKRLSSCLTPPSSWT